MTIRSEAVGASALCALLFLGCSSDLGEARSSPGSSTQSGEPGQIAAPDLSYPGEEAGTALTDASVEAQRKSPADTVPAEPGVPPPPEAMRIFLVALDRGGGEAGEAGGGETFGCGDRLRGVEVPVAGEGLDTAGRIGAALGALLATEGGPEVPGGLYSAFERSRLTVERVEPVAGVAGLFRVELSGQLRLGGVCDNPRVRAQLEATARQFAGVDDVEILIDDQPLDSFLTGRG